MIAAPSGRLLAMATDLERIEAARLVAERMREHMAGLDPIGSLYVDSAGGVILHDRRFDPKFAQVNSPAPRRMARLRRRAPSVASPLDDPRFAPRPWAPAK